MKEIDARGLSCPIPVLRTKEALDEKPEELAVLVDEETQVENVRRIAASCGYETKEVKEEDDHFRLILSRKE